MRFLSLASIGVMSWQYPFASMTLGSSILMVGLDWGSMLPSSSLLLPMTISMSLPLVRSGSSFMMPRVASSVGTLMSSTILCILLFGLSGVARKSSKEAIWWFTMSLSLK